jgi:hypothetical protein
MTILGLVGWWGHPPCTKEPDADAQSESCKDFLFRDLTEEVCQKVAVRRPRPSRRRQTSEQI